MKLFSTEKKVIGFHETYYDKNNPKGSGYCAKQRRVQKLIKSYKFLNFTYFKNVLDEEEVPSHVWIALGSLGYDSSGWKSKFKEYIK